MNLFQYLMPTHHIRMGEVSYKALGKDVSDTVINVAVSFADELNVTKEGNNINVALKRSLKCDPDDFIALSVTYEAVLSINPDADDQPDWDGLDLYDEFMGENSGFISVLAAKVSKVISDLTIEMPYPIITPPSIIRSDGVG